MKSFDKSIEETAEFVRLNAAYLKIVEALQAENAELKQQLAGREGCDGRPEYNSVTAGQLLCIRNALVVNDYDTAYELLYAIADPNFTSIEPWAEMERIAGGKLNAV